MFRIAAKHYFSHYQGISWQGWVVLSANLVNRIGSATIIFLSLYLHQVLKFSLSEIGTILAIFGCGSIVGSFLGGIINSNYDSTRILMVTLLFTGSLFMVFPFASSFYTITMMLLCLGTNISIGQTAINLVIDRFSGDSRTRLKMFSIYRVMNNIGMSITGIIGGVLATYNFRILFLIDGVTSLLAASLLIKLLRHAHLQNTSEQTSENNKPISYSRIMRDKYFVKLLLLFIYSLLAFNQLMSSYSIYLTKTFMLSTKDIGTIYAISGILIAIWQVPLTNYIKDQYLQIAMNIGLLCFGLGFGLMPFGHSFSFIVFLCIIWTIGEMLFFPANMTLILNYVQGIDKAKYMACYQAAFAFSRLVFPTLGLRIYEHLGGHILWELILTSSLVVFAILTLSELGTTKWAIPE